MIRLLLLYFGGAMRDFGEHNSSFLNLTYFYAKPELIA